MKGNINPYYQRPKTKQQLIEEQRENAIREREKVLAMSDAERDIYYKEKELAIQREMLQNQAMSINMQQRQYKSMAKCPRCGSTSISSHKKGYGVVKGGLGALALGSLTGGVGAVIGLGAGNMGRKKTYNVCQKCGKKF